MNTSIVCKLIVSQADIGINAMENAIKADVERDPVDSKITPSHKQEAARGVIPDNKVDHSIS